MRTHSAAGYKQRDQAHGTLRVVPLGIENSSNRSSPFANPANRKIYVALLVVAIPVLVALYATQNAAFAVAFTIVLLFAVTLVPLAGLCAMMASIPIVNALPPLPIVSSATAVLGAMTFVSVLLRMSKANRDLQRSTRQIYLLIFGLFFSMILSMIFGLTFQPSALFTFVQLFVLVWIVTQIVRSSTDVERLMFSWVVATGFVNLVGLTTFDLAIIGRQNRYASFGNNANYLAYYSIASIWFGMYLLQRFRSFATRIPILVLIFANLLGTVLTVSRTGMLTFAATALFSLWLMRRLPSRTAVVLGVLFLSLYILSVNLETTEVVQQMQGIPGYISGQLTKDNSWTDRELLWRLWLQKWNDSPLFGIGVGATFGGRVLSANVVHNSFLTVLVETGAVGLVFFVGILFRTWINLQTTLSGGPPEFKFSLDSAWKLAWLTYIITSISCSLEYDKMIWLLVGIGIVISENRYSKSFWR